MVDRPIFASVEAIFERNPSIRMLIMAAINGSQSEVSFDRLAETLEQVKRPKTCTQTSRSVIALSVANGALKQTLYVDGVPYDGTLEDLRNDDSLREGVDISYTVQATDEGLRIAAMHVPEKALASLFSSKPLYAQGFLMVLEGCSQKGGLTRDEINELLERNPSLVPHDPKTGAPLVRPAYFTGELEDSGALVWEGTWRTTTEGKAFLRTRKGGGASAETGKEGSKAIRGRKE